MSRRTFLRENGATRKLLNAWIDSNQNLYKVNPVVKLNVFKHLLRCKLFYENVEKIGYNGAFLSFIKELVAEHGEDTSKTKTRYNAFYNTINTLDGRWDLPVDHINIKHDFPGI